MAAVKSGRPTRRRLRSPGVPVAVASALVACALAWTPSGPRRVEPIPLAEPIGAEECGVCHEEVQGHARIASYHADCESCHGGGSLHADSEEIRDIRHPAAGDCLACHAPGRDTHLQWGTGEHSRAGLLCSDCHNPHAVTRNHLRETSAVGSLEMDAASRLCAECPVDVASQLTYPSHHPVREGMMACTSCHDPHEDRRVTLGDRNQRCYGCHQDYAGPWVYEHLPVVEDCANCHDPHGAPGENLLETVQPVICLSCHTLNDLWHHTVAGTGVATNVFATQDAPTAPGEVIGPGEARPFLHRCTNCHGAVHGSYTDEHLRH